MKRLILATFAVAVLATLPTACGVPAEDSPRAIETTAPPSQPSPVPTPVETGPVKETLFMVKDGLLFEVERRLPAVPSPMELLDDLIVGPTEEERDAGISSALLGSTLVVNVTVANGEATVELASNEEGSTRNDQVLAYGQIVCTLAARESISTVRFTRDGQPVEVPRGNTKLTQDPLTADDYANLFQDGATPKPAPSAS